MDYINPIYMFSTMFINMLCYVTTFIALQGATCIIFVVLIKRIQQLFS